MIGPGLDSSLGALDSNWDRARELHAQVREAMQPVFATVSGVLRRWGEMSPEERAHHRGEFFGLVRDMPAHVRFIWAECPGLPAEIRRELEAML